jgi:UDP-glucose 4-epimerase
VEEVIKMEKILVTGGAGLIGSNIAKKLAKDNHVIILDNFSTGRRENCKNLDVIEYDIRNTDLGKILEGVDVVYHMAAELGVERIVGRDKELWEVEVDGTENLLKACVNASVKKFLFASTSEVYGHYPDDKLPMSENDAFEPDTLYGQAKRKGEELCRSYSEKYGMKTVSIRYFNVYGPHQSRGGFVVPAFIHCLLNGKDIKINADGKQVRDFTYVDDAADATIKVCQDGFDKEVFNIGSGKPVSMNELAKKLMDVSGIETNIIYVPIRRPTDTHNKYANAAKIKNAVGWNATTGLEDGLRITLESYK